MFPKGHRAILILKIISAYYTLGTDKFMCFAERKMTHKRVKKNEYPWKIFYDGSWKCYDFLYAVVWWAFTKTRIFQYCFWWFKFLVVGWTLSTVVIFIFLSYFRENYFFFKFFRAKLFCNVFEKRPGFLFCCVLLWCTERRDFKKRTPGRQFSFFQR